MVYFTQRNRHTRTSVSKDKCLITFQTRREKNPMNPNFKGLIKSMSIWADELSKQTEYMARLCELICLLQARLHEVKKTTSEETVLQSYR